MPNILPRGTGETCLVAVVVIDRVASDADARLADASVLGRERCARCLSAMTAAALALAMTKVSVSLAATRYEMVVEVCANVLGGGKEQVT